MKNFMIALCLMTISYAATAQYDPAFRFGVKAGANLSNINGSNDLTLASGNNPFNFKDNDNRSLGFVGGVFFRFGKSFYIQPEILLSQKGGRFNVYEDGVQDSNGKVDVRFSNLDVPILFGVRVAKFFRINVGPMASLRLSNNGKIGDSFDVITGENSAEFKNRLAYGYQAGVGFDFGRLSLDVRYEGNFTDIVKVEFDNATTASQFGKKSNLFQATLGFAIF
ncbi:MULTISPECIES: porin family protein [Dyadobacter]|uniref:PorT family protein n=1 Tax=Dyadobacter chenhuakuii TaxID=2909339 RepID=A0A9X1QJ59_9BACT|nr:MULTISPECIES: porin family protein [Dyadobacter]MCF2493832.1 PorT family protein [Dyadobacter chenhuakuii]MCF2500659.1 PorT family protein [Dyadobacter chenhuakuii]MCF2518077.1 PorT family protein [Dyadobacter sp. CY351]USJ30964.1 PorT family protein [Dyadobacter chenhuakuii]